MQRGNKDGMRAWSPEFMKWRKWITTYVNGKLHPYRQDSNLTQKCRSGGPRIMTIMWSHAQRRLAYRQFSLNSILEKIGKTWEGLVQGYIVTNTVGGQHGRNSYNSSINYDTYELNCHHFIIVWILPKPHTASKKPIIQKYQRVCFAWAEGTVLGRKVASQKGSPNTQRQSRPDTLGLRIESRTQTNDASEIWHLLYSDMNYTREAGAARPRVRYSNENNVAFRCTF